MSGVPDLLGIVFDMFRVLLCYDSLIGGFFLCCVLLLLFVGSFFSVGPFSFVFCWSFLILLIVRVVVCKIFERVRHGYGKKRY